MRICTVVHDDEASKVKVLYTEDFFVKYDKYMQEAILANISLRFQQDWSEILEEIKELNDE